jgi:hypothetical protein
VTAVTGTGRVVLYNTCVMIDVFLLPEASVVTSNGDSAPVDISGAEHRIFLINVSVTAVIEQQSVELSVFTSADGTTWETKPVAGLPQKFYVGEYPLLVDLSQNPEARVVRAHWDVNRWGRGANTPRFEMGVRLREVPPALLSEARERAGATS